MVSSAGSSLAEAMEAIRSGRAAGPDPRPLETAIASPPPAFVVRGTLAGGEGHTRTSRLALTALVEALDCSDLARSGIDPARIGVVMGTTVGCSFNGEPFWRSYREDADPGPAAIDRYIANDLASVVAGAAGAMGPRMTVANACASGTDAIGIASLWLNSGRCDAVVAGGADEIERFSYLGFLSLKNMSHARCRPFDRRRDGLNLGEGAGIVVLEREDAASRRDARILGRILGYSNASDAHHLTSPHPEGRGLLVAMARAMAMAGVGPADIGFVNAHGTATVENDRVEGRAIASLLTPSVTVSTKGSTGHTLGAAGAIEAILTLRSLEDGVVPPTIGLEDPDPECLVSPTMEAAATDGRAAMSTSLAFGGTNSVLVVGRS